ncbi:MAG: hypothetical protein QM532_02675 [Cyanobium sp. MAG06]|nr:hypothetical protein [Cyanobium sp. MAG06]
MIEIISQILLFIYLYFLVFMLMTFIYKSREIENEEIINID